VTAASFSGVRRGAPAIGLLGCVLAFALFAHGWLGVANIGLGIASGAAVALQALGVVLVFRANRIVNFAQVQVGLVGATLCAALVQGHVLIRSVQGACTGCVPANPQEAPGWMLGAEYAIAVVLALGVSAGIGAVAYYTLLRRFERAPRLVLTVATIGLAQVLAWLEAQLPQLFISRDQFGRLSGSANVSGAAAPFNLSVTIDGRAFGTGDVLTAGAAVLACLLLAAFLTWSRLGVTMRAAADNPERARTLRVNVDGVNAAVWVLAGLLSGVGGLLSGLSNGLDPSAPLSVVSLVAILAAALAGRFESLALAVAAAFVFGVLQASLTRWTGTSDLYQGALIAVIVVLLLLPGAAGRTLRDSSEAWAGTREARPVPGVLRASPSVQSAARWLGAAGALVVLGLPFALSPSQLEVGSTTVLYALVGLSLLVLTGWAGQISLGQFALAACGAYVAVLLGLEYGVAAPLAVLAGACAGAAGATLIGLPALRLRGLNLAVLTLALAVAVPVVLLNPSYLGGPLQDQVLNRPIVFGLDLNDERAFYYLCLGVLAVALAGVFALRRSRTGRTLIAARDNEQAARALALDVFRLRLGAFAIAGFIAGLAGALLAFEQRGVPVLSYGADTSVQVFLMVVIGGLGSLAGPVLGALYLALGALLPGQVPTFLLTGAGTLLILLAAPGGLAQVLTTIRDGWLRRVAQHQRIDAPSLLGDRGLAHGPAPLAPRAPGAHSLTVRYRLEEPNAL
jgi:ABC-type branched-subunit amino acid transport system permease subunit